MKSLTHFIQSTGCMVLTFDLRERESESLKEENYPQCFRYPPKRRRILTTWPRILEVYSLLTAITTTILDVLDLFCGCKSVRLSVNRDPDHPHHCPPSTLLTTGPHSSHIICQQLLWLCTAVMKKFVPTACTLYNAWTAELRRSL